MVFVALTMGYLPTLYSEIKKREALVKQLDRACILSPREEAGCDVRVILVLLAALAVGCGQPQRDRVIVLGLDGVDPRVVDLLVSEGKLPNFARLRQEGSYGRLRSSKPMLSPILWTTIATGKPPLEHGITDFVTVNETTGESLPATSQMRRVKAIWNLLSSAEREVAVVGWWATWPAEPVLGTIISDHVGYHFLLGPADGAERHVDGLTHPPGTESSIAPLIRRPEDVTHAQAARFVDVASDNANFIFDKVYANLKRKNPGVQYRKCKNPLERGEGRTYFVPDDARSDAEDATLLVADVYPWDGGNV